MLAVYYGLPWGWCSAAHDVPRCGEQVKDGETWATEVHAITQVRSPLPDAWVGGAFPGKS
jgi:hypothetical protein